MSQPLHRTRFVEESLPIEPEKDFLTAHSQEATSAKKPASGGASGSSPHPPKPSRVPGLTPQQADKALHQALRNQRRLLQLRKGQIQRWNARDQKQFKTWFGATDQATRNKITERIDKELALNQAMTLNNFKRAPTVDPGTFAYVYPNDKSHTIYIDGAFAHAPATGKDSQAGTLAHEMSHFKSISGTKDYVYGTTDAKKLARQNPSRAANNADSFEYFIEGVH